MKHQHCLENFLPMKFQLISINMHVMYILDVIYVVFIVNGDKLQV